IEQAHGHLDVLVHNAGGGLVADIETCNLDQWRKVQALNVESVFMGTQAALPLMRASGRSGSIVVVSSIAGLVGEPDLAAYGAAKGAVRVLSKTIALHCARRGDPIRCNSVHPGFTDTPMVQKMAERYPDPVKAHHKLSTLAPLRRLGTPQEVASLVLYLASDESGFVTGAEMVIDGGMTSR
ncbi:MAG: SDR family oxidoreductase, partial [Deltaproteobacteria bacterium]|nr:SDR family oxidoreductase [Deltaproteobacteria bacterium]